MEKTNGKSGGAKSGFLSNKNLAVNPDTDILKTD
jgi:hypothetical protein